MLFPISWMKCCQQAAHARGAPQAFSFHSSTHTSASSLPFTQPTMQLSFKFQSRNLRGLAISLQKLSAGFVTHAATTSTARERSVANHAASGLVGAAFDSLILFFLRVSCGRGPTLHLSIAKLAGAGAEMACRRSRSIDREPVLQASRIFARKSRACLPGYKT